VDSFREDLASGDLGILDLAGPAKKRMRAFSKEDAREAERFLDYFVERGVIDEHDRFLIVGVHLYGRKLRHLADESGVAYETAKKRKQRAESAIRRFVTRGKERK
jgi:hypothetical protein